MYKIMLFAGTTEGRELVRRFRNRDIQFHVFVATGYGGELLEGQDNVIVHPERLNREAMEALMPEGWDLVLDATHPYAVEVSANLKAACESQGLPYMRIVRESAVWSAADKSTASRADSSAIISVPDIAAAAQYLEQTEGKVLLTTGSKEIEAFTKVKDYQTRIIARVLPVPDSVMKCMELGFKGQNLICMQGPFSAKLNREMLLQTNAKWLVTKESGNPGGFRQKLEGARSAGAQVIVVGRPATENGYSFEQAVEFIERAIPAPAAERKTRRPLSLIGIGPYSSKYLCQEAALRIRRADLIIGAERMIEAVDTAGKTVLRAWQPDVIKEYLAAHPEYTAPVILLSGDTGFYSGAKHLTEALQDYQTELIPGISSLAYMAARLGKSWEQVRTVSIHGRRREVVNLLRRHKELFVLLENAEQLQQLCKELLAFSYQQVKVCIGENLGMENEQITCGRPAELLAYQAGNLAVVWIEHDADADPVVTPGLPDDAFIRGKVPMTKQEVRTISLAALALRRGSVLYDIGAGTGSVSIEAACQAYEGQVYAIEQKEEALQLISKNVRKFGTANVHIVPGTAPEVLAELPSPDRIFIGGTSGNLNVMLDQIYRQWPRMRTVLNAASLETLAAVTAWLGEHEECEADIVQLSAARAKPVGRYHMMQGGTIVYVITIQGKGSR